MSGRIVYGSEDFEGIYRAWLADGQGSTVTVGKSVYMALRDNDGVYFIRKGERGDVFKDSYGSTSWNFNRDKSDQ